MKKSTLCVILILSLPACATITNVQSNAKWTCTGTGSPITCSVILTTQPTTTGNLLAVWTFWESTSTYVAVVSDSKSNGVNGVFPGAVGPTLQSASNTSGQIFYAANITGTTPPNKDTVTVTFTCPATNPSCTSPTITAGGVVAVEYSGADPNYPLDSVSAGYSTGGNPTGLLDSGTVAPANANLLVFGGGIIDNGTASAGSGFTSIQAHTFTAGGAITEQNTSAISGNNVLQRATACLSASVPCPAMPTGNWLMQMAVFRDASWTVAGGWTPARQGNILYADPFPTLGTALSAMPPVGGTLTTPSQYNPTLSTAINLGSPTQPIGLLMGSASSFTWNSSISSPPYGLNIFNASSLSCLPGGVGSGCYLKTGSSFTGSGLVSNGSYDENQEYFALDHLFLDCRSGTMSTDSRTGGSGCLELTNIYIPSSVRNTVAIGGPNSAALGMFGHTNGQGQGQNSNDVLFDQDWFTCITGSSGTASGCTPVDLEVGNGQSGLFNIYFVGGAIENPGPTKPAVNLATDTDIAFFGTSFTQGTTVSPTKPVIDISRSTAVGFYNNGCGAYNNQYCINVENLGTPDSITAINLWTGNKNSINNGVSGTIVNQTYVPFYFYNTMSNPGWFDGYFKTTQGYGMVEGTAPTCASGVDCLYADSTAHAVEASYNNDAFKTFPRVFGSGQVTINPGAVSSGACSPAITASVAGVTTSSVIHWSFASDPSAVTGYGGSTSAAIVQL